MNKPIDLLLQGAAIVDVKQLELLCESLKSESDLGVVIKSCSHAHHALGEFLGVSPSKLSFDAMIKKARKEGRLRSDLIDALDYLRKIRNEWGHEPRVETRLSFSDGRLTELVAAFARTIEGPSIGVDTADRAMRSAIVEFSNDQKHEETARLMFEVSAAVLILALSIMSGSKLAGTAVPPVPRKTSRWKLFLAALSSLFWRRCRTDVDRGTITVD